MDTVLDIARSGLTVTMTPAQLLVAVGLLGVAFASNAKSLVFAWHVKSPYACHLTLLTGLGTTLRTTCTAFPSTAASTHSKERPAWRRVPLRPGGHDILHPSPRYRL